MNNLLQDIFLEFFWKRYYFQKKWRAYVEYIVSSWKKFTGKICFFHFSLENTKLNTLHNYEIFKFIRLFYSNAYQQLLPLMQLAIRDEFVMSMNSLDEYTFIIKFWNENTTIRNLFKDTIYTHTGKQIILDEDDTTIRFFELKISVKKWFCIEEIIIYSEKDMKWNIKYVPWFIDKNNVFMTLEMKKYLNFDNFKTLQTGILIKFQNPIRFSNSEYLMNQVYDMMDISFPPESLYAAFIEQWFIDESIYFTHNYSIPA